MRNLTSYSLAAALSLACGLLDGGCGILDCRNDKTTAEPLDLMTGADLYDVAHIEPDDVDFYVGRFVAVGAAGLIVIDGGEKGFVQEHPTAVDLHAVRTTAHDIIAVGDAGTVLRADIGVLAWTIVDAKTDAALWDIATLSTSPSGPKFTLAVGDDAIVLQDPGSGTWSPLAAPTGGWGKLRKVFVGGDRFYAVGLAGTVWTTHDPQSEWAREDPDTNADLLAGGGDFESNGAIVIGTGGTARVRKDGKWSAFDTGVTVDLVDLDLNLAAAADGRLYELSSTDAPRRVIDLGRPVRAIHRDIYSPIDVVGPGGFASRVEIPSCE